MLITVFLILFIFCIRGAAFVKSGYNSNYLSISQCNFVKGVCIIWVFIRHINQYILANGYKASSIGDDSYFGIELRPGQFIVVMFFFFSGYGIIEQYKKKGREYISSIPKKRIISTLINFDISVLFFIVLNLLLNKTMTIGQVFLSFIAWDSVGNSNWYIFTIILCYILTYLTLRVNPDSNKGQAETIIIFSLFLISMFVLSLYKESWWYNTMLCFPLGMIYSKYQVKIERLFQSYYIKVFLILFGLLFAFLLIPYPLRGLTYNLASMSFALIMVLLMMKFDLNSKYLQWMGQKLFPLYVYQRIMMIAINEMPWGKDFITSYPLIYIFICFMSVLLIAYFYPKWQVSIK